MRRSGSLLRKPRLEDVDDLLEFAGDGEVMRWIGGEAGGREAAVEHVERWLARWEANGVGQFVVLLDEPDHRPRRAARLGLAVVGDVDYDEAGAARRERARLGDLERALGPRLRDRGGASGACAGPTRSAASSG